MLLEVDDEVEVEVLKHQKKKKNMVKTELSRSAVAVFYLKATLSMWMRTKRKR